MVTMVLAHFQKYHNSITKVLHLHKLYIWRTFVQLTSKFKVVFFF